MTVAIAHGVNSLDLNVAGQTVDQVRGTVSQVLGLSGDEKIEVNGQTADGGRYLQDGDEVEFVKTAGTKGL